MTRKHEKRMTENQYRTLRKLILLWFTVVVRRKYSIFMNLLLAVSLLLNASFFYYHKTGNHISIIEKPIDFNYALDIKNYDSISNGKKQNLQQRYNILYKRYLEDKSKPDSFYYPDRSSIAEDDWRKYCKNQIRKIVYIKTRIRDIEKLIEETYPNDSEKLQRIIEHNNHEDVLADMSNYYARFLSAEEYEYLIKTMD